MPRLAFTNSTATNVTVPVADEFVITIAPNTVSTYDLTDTQAELVLSLLTGISGITSTVQQISVGGTTLGGYDTIQDEGIAVTKRAKVNFVGSGVTAVDNPGADRTDVTITGGGGGAYSTIQEEGVSLTQRAILNFIGASVTAVDNAGSTRTDVTISSGGGSIAPVVFTPNVAQFPSSSPATVASRNGHPLIAFNDTTNQNIEFNDVISTGYAGGTITLLIDWIAATATTANVKWNAQFERMGSGGTSVDSDSFATARTTTAPTSATNGFIARTSITFTQAQADAVTANDAFRLRITRDAADSGDTMAGDAQIVMAQLML